jgi:[ribosomal protein S18]-alanine N-acetyltransferase
VPEEGKGARGDDTVLESRTMKRAHCVVRPMEHEDIPQVARIDREAFPGEWVFRSQSAYRRDLDNPSVRYVVACREGAPEEPRRQAAEKARWFRRLFRHGRGNDAAQQVIGFSGFWMLMHEAHIIAIGVRDGYRRLGIGEGLLIATIELAQVLNADVLTLEVRASNGTAQALYQKYGFQVTGRRLRYYSSDGEDAIIMSTDSIASTSFEGLLQELRRAHAQRHPEILVQVG